eukprot:Nitzschia sp. Nitz4//scaffold22_size323478//217941//218663//NITZ4_000561-RA/size323478-processed-gene-0.417-mRNA-1//1//CDS//3329543097//2283//frame0
MDTETAIDLTMEVDSREDGQEDLVNITPTASRKRKGVTVGVKESSVKKTKPDTPSPEKREDSQSIPSSSQGSKNETKDDEQRMGAAVAAATDIPTTAVATKKGESLPKEDSTGEATVPPVAPQGSPEETNEPVDDSPVTPPVQGEEAGIIEPTVEEVVSPVPPTVVESECLEETKASTEEDNAAEASEAAVETKGETSDTSCEECQGSSCVGTLVALSALGFASYYAYEKFRTEYHRFFM